MDYGSTEGGLIKAYLLGELAEADRDELERRMMTDDDFYNLVLLAEDDLAEQYALGRLSGKEKERFEATFFSTEAGREQVNLTSALIRLASSQSAEKPAAASYDVQPPQRKRSFFTSYAGMLAAAIIILAVGSGVWRIFIYESDAEKGAAALRSAYRGARPLEARLTGFDYAPPVTLRGGDQENANRVARDRAARILLDEVAESPSAASHHAVGQLYLSERKFVEAISHFEAALRADPRNARGHADLGAALLEKGKIARTNDEPGKSLEEFAKSLEHLNRALELDGSLNEALFNRALLYEYMSLPQQAEADWKSYLERDPGSAWAEEARRHLDQLEERKRSGSRNRGELFFFYL